MEQLFNTCNVRCLNLAIADNKCSDSHSTCYRLADVLLDSV